MNQAPRHEDDPRDDEARHDPTPAEPGHEEEALRDMDAAEAEDPPTEDPPTPEQQELATIRAELAELQAQLKEMNDRLLRERADYQHLARRADASVAAAREQAWVDMARSMVNVLDHFDHALAVDPEKASVKDLLGGMTIVRDELLKAMGQFGVERLNVEPGEAFDPNQHEALMRTETDDVDSGCVAQQLQPGYTMGTKTIRPAKVAVAS